MGIDQPELNNIDRTKKEFNCQLGLDACQKLNVETYVTAKELAEVDTESIGIMAMLAQFKYVKPVAYSPIEQLTENTRTRTNARVYLNEFKSETDKIFRVGRPVCGPSYKDFRHILIYII